MNAYNKTPISFIAVIGFLASGISKEEEEYAAVHGHRRADGDVNIELRAGIKQREEALAEAGREREKRSDLRRL